MSLTDKTVDCCGLNLYQTAKYSTVAEICLTGNFTHAIEAYGLWTKKPWAISFGYFWRMFIVVGCVLTLIILYGTYLGTEVYGVQGDYDDIKITVQIIMVTQVLYNGFFKIVYQLSIRTLIEEEQDLEFLLQKKAPLTTKA